MSSAPAVDKLAVSQGRPFLIATATDFCLGMLAHAH